MQLSLLATTGADLDRLAAELRRLQGVTRVTQVFPGHADEELRRMFVLDVDDDSSDAVLAIAATSVKDVELVEPTPKRRTM